MVRVLKEPGQNDFWDLQRLVPKKRRPTLESFITSPPLAEVSVDGGETPSAGRALHIEKEFVKSDTYSVADNLFLSDVTLDTYAEGYNLYHRFMEDAENYAERQGEETAYVRYFSYMPQYTQLTAAQLAYYFYWRAQLRAGHGLQCDEGYLYLYAYECINLIDVRLSPAEALERLLTLWQTYAHQFPKINKYFSEWVADLCLIYRISPPREKLTALLPLIWKQASFPEFYFGAAGEVTLHNTGLLLALLCDYDYRSSKCFTAVPEKQGKVFIDTLEHSMFGVFHELFSGGTETLRAKETKTVTHSAFCGAVYAKEQRIRLTVRYAPIAEATEVRALVSAAAKYSENLYRALHGNRNRLAVPEFPACYRSVLDAYYRVFFREREKEKTQAAEPAYMAQYAPRETGVTLSRADEIESLSWENTQRLVPTDEPATDAEGIHAPETEQTQAVPEATPAESEELSGDAVAYLQCVLYGDAARMAAFAPCADRLAEQINQMFLTDPAVGDIVLEPTDSGYKLVDDYQSEVEEWIQNR